MAANMATNTQAKLNTPPELASGATHSRAHARNQRSNLQRHRICYSCRVDGLGMFRNGVISMAFSCCDSITAPLGCDAKLLHTPTGQWRKLNLCTVCRTCSQRSEFLYIYSCALLKNLKSSVRMISHARAKRNLILKTPRKRKNRCRPISCPSSGPYTTTFERALRRRRTSKP